MKKIIQIVLTLIGFIYCSNIQSQDTLLNILSSELIREVDGLKTQPIAPYYIEYRVDDLKTLTLSTSFGSLVGENEDNGKILTTSVKVGNYQFDNSHEVAGTDGISGQPFTVRLPFENIPEALKVTIWQATHYAYRSAVDNFNQVQSGMKDESKIVKSSDFSLEKPSVYFEAE